NSHTNNSWTTTSPGALTELFDASTAGGDDSAVGGAWALKAGGGATGNGTATMNAANPNGGILLALRPCTLTCTTPLTPADGATETPITPLLAWNPQSCATSYDVYFGTAMTPPLVSNNQGGATYNPGTLVPNTTYYWRIVPSNSGGDAAGCATW